MSISYNTPVSNGDPLDSLPTDQSSPSVEEIQMVENLFPAPQSTFNRILSQSKGMLVLGLLFLLFSLPQADSLLGKIIPATRTSPYMQLGIKTVIFVVVYYIVTNLYLVRKK